MEDIRVLMLSTSPWLQTRKKPRNAPKIYRNLEFWVKYNFLGSYEVSAQHIRTYKDNVILFLYDFCHKIAFEIPQKFWPVMALVTTANKQATSANNLNKLQRETKFY